jgi:polysaccharide export outer membrane protein
MRPSQVTPPGIRIFMSNLTVPVANNSEQHQADVPYGTRLLEAAISANCVGGTVLTNGARRIAYVSSQAQTSQVKEYRVNDLLANPNDMAGNPFMMPNDAIACFDSEVVNIRDATRALTEMLSLAGLAASLL